MRIARPTKAVAAKLVCVLRQLQTITRRNLERGQGTALDLRALADELASKPLQEWYAEANAQLKAHEQRPRRRN